MKFWIIFVLAMVASFVVPYGMGVLLQDREDPVPSVAAEPLIGNAPKAVTAATPQPSRHPSSMEQPSMVQARVPQARIVTPAPTTELDSPPPPRTGYSGGGGTQYVDAGPSAPVTSNIPDASPLPIQIRFRRIKDSVQGTIVNTSKEPLSVEVNVVTSGNQTTLELAPGTPTPIGTRDGLELHSGDKVHFHSPAYRDMDVIVS